MEQVKLFILQGFKFGLVGISNTIISLICFNLLIHFNVPYLYANVTGYSLGMINSYYWNYRFVFKQEELQLGQVVKFILGNVIVLLCSSCLLYVFVEILTLNAQIAYIISLVVTMLFNFLLSKFIVFNDVRE